MSSHGQQWKTRATLGFYLLSTAIAVMTAINMYEYRNEVRALREDRDHDYRERVAWTTSGWVSRSRKQDGNLGLYQNRIAAFLAHCRKERNGCNLPETLTYPVEAVPVESTEALLIAS